MGETRMIPVNMSQRDLLAVLDDIRARIAEGDSFEGHIEWLMPMDDNAPARSFDVRASYRVGNTMGQGGMRMIGQWAEVPGPAGPEDEERARFLAEAAELDTDFTGD